MPVFRQLLEQNVTSYWQARLSGTCSDIRSESRTPDVRANLALSFE